MYFHVWETQRTRMHATGIAATPNGHQMAVVVCNRSIIQSCPNFNGGLGKPPLKLAHGWVISSNPID